MLAMHALLLVWLLSCPQISTAGHPQVGIGGGNLPSPPIRQLPQRRMSAPAFVQANGASVANASNSHHSFNHNSAFAGISSPTAGARLTPIVAAAGINGWLQNYDGVTNDIQKQHLRMMSANAFGPNGGEQEEQQIEQNQTQLSLACHTFTTRSIKEIEEVVDSLFEKSANKMSDWRHNLRYYQPWQLISALVHTNRILGHHLGMCIIMELKDRLKLENEKLATELKTIDNHVPTSMLLDHMSFEQLKRVIFGVLGVISPPATVDVNHGMPILATEPADVTQEKIMAELNGARHYLECLEKVQCF